jgi:hypothetical protein
MEELINAIKEKYNTLVYLSSRIDEVSAEPILEETPFMLNENIKNIIKY